MILRLTSRQLQKLRNEARKNYPMEACALIFGNLTNGEAIVKWVVMMPNVLKSTVRFEADPKSVFDAFEKADRRGLQFIGLFHSHPASARPSGIDLQFMRLWGEAVWLILSLTDGNVAAFQMIDGDVSEVVLRVQKK